MQRDNRLFDDLARVASGAFSSFSALREEAEARVHEQIERVLQRMDVVPRDEFEAVRAMAVKAREENEALAARLGALEEQLAKPAKTTRTATAGTKKSATKAAAGKGRTKATRRRIPPSK